MRNSLIASLLPYCSSMDACLCVLCGDLGYNALEPLEEKLGRRFINAGIAEQNMISTAAGMAENGMHPWVYSISPFLYARAFEQIRNDICLQNLPVCLIGSGAGFGYGMAGPSHHAIEDYGVISALQNMTVYIPSFKTDFKFLTPAIIAKKTPAYIRLGRDEAPDGFIPPDYRDYRKLLPGNNTVVLTIGGLSGSVLDWCLQITPENRPELWCGGKLPVIFNDIPEQLLGDISKAKSLLIIEDHVATGGLGQQFLSCIMQHGIVPQKYRHICIKGYFDGAYGSQSFYRSENKIDKESFCQAIQLNN